MEGGQLLNFGAKPTEGSMVLVSCRVQRSQGTHTGLKGTSVALAAAGLWLLGLCSSAPSCPARLLPLTSKLHLD